MEGDLKENYDFYKMELTFKQGTVDPTASQVTDSNGTVYSVSSRSTALLESNKYAKGDTVSFLDIDQLRLPTDGPTAGKWCIILCPCCNNW